MAKRTTISIPDDLYEKMEKWKGEINFSGEFQKHISELIEKKERYKKRLKEVETMDDVIERLRSERDESQKEWEEIGKKEGLEWAKTAHYDEIQYVFNWNIDEMPSSDIAEGESLMRYFEEIFNTYPQLGIETDPYVESWVNESASVFMEGWIDGVSDFWDEVASKL